MSFLPAAARWSGLSAQLHPDPDTFLKLNVAQTIMGGFSWTREREVGTYIIFLTPEKDVDLFLAALLDQGFHQTSRKATHNVTCSLPTPNNY